MTTHWGPKAAALMMSLVCGYSIIAQADESPSIEVYMRASCECCRPWIKYMQSEGFQLNVHFVESMPTFKNERGVPPELSSCHTATIDGYLLEGHVSAEEVRQLLRERPKIVGLFVPGMPKGAPGMPDSDAPPYDVLALDAKGNTTIYASHGATDAGEPTK